MKTVYKLTITILLSIVTSQSFGVTNQTPDFTQTIAKRYSEIWIKQPQEKVYIHTDKPYYSAGERIWLKAYLTNASTHIPNTLSRFIYIELINDLDSTISRHKIRKDSLGGFSGYIDLSPKLPLGYYSLRGYTNWMQNVSSDFNFTKSLFIGNSIDDRLNCNVAYIQEGNNQLKAQFTFTNTFQTPMSGINVSLKQNWMKSYKKIVNLTTNEAGQIDFLMNDSSIIDEKKIIEITINEPGNKFSHKYVVPDMSNDFDLQFFPESGTMLNSGIQIIAFKAIGTNGLHANISGNIFNNNNEVISTLSSANKGMGKVAFSSNPSESYYAIVKSDKGVEKRFELPATKSEGIAIHLRNSTEDIVYEIINKTSIPDSSLYYLIHSRGKPIILQKVKMTNGRIPYKILPEGIISFSIIDNTGNTYCERLSFIKKNHSPIIEMLSNKKGYGKREPVELNFKINSQYGISSEGNYSVSITDSKNVRQDTLGNNIISYLLLSSDIKGHIEDPTSYFLDNSRITNEKLDLLMLTQGWKRFNTALVSKGDFKSNDKFYMEIGQALSGKVLNIFAKPVKNSQVIMLMSYKNRIGIAETDSAGRFLIDGIEFPDSTTIILKAKRNKNIADVEIIPDQDIFTNPSCYFPKLMGKLIPAPKEYFQISKEKYYNEGGMMVVNLMEVDIKASKKESNKVDRFYSGLASTNINSEKLEQYPGMNFLDLLVMVPGVQVNGDQVSIRGSQNQPLYLVDGIETDDIQYLTYLTSNDIEEISIFKGADAAIFGSKGGSGAIAITLKSGYIRTEITPSSLAKISPLGFQKPTEFYVPKYNIDSIRTNPKADLRTTIYWNPELTVDSTGNAKVKFYTADKANNYNVELEGISKKGEICRFLGYIKREDY